LLDRQIRRLFALENTAHITTGESVGVDAIGASAGRRSFWPSTQRYSIVTSRPST
jgi:hypothetical protein